MPRSRLLLGAHATVWRSLMDIGMLIHKLAPPYAPSPDFTKSIPVTISPFPGEILLYFYVPKSYKSDQSDSNKRHPIVINFHGGGFTLGRGTDDARWASAVGEQTESVVVSVDYRLAPKYPFPTAVEDGTDAILWIAAHADELLLDKERIALSGFSAGGNLCFSVPVRLQDYFSNLTNIGHAEIDGETPVIPAIRAIMSFYPATDYSVARSVRKESNERRDLELPDYLTSLFDESYIYDTSGGVVDTSNPYLSPGVMSDQMLSILPEHISIWACEWDGLRAEARRLADRLESRTPRNKKAILEEDATAVDIMGEDLTKVKVKFRIVEGARHGWDKAPNPFGMHATVERSYKEACADLKEAFEQSGPRG